jgi:hypothetical protein
MPADPLPREVRRVSNPFSKPSTPDLPAIVAATPQPSPPSRDDDAVQEARRKELANAARRRGRASTILTSGSGDTSEAPVGRRMLLGG